TASQAVEAHRDLIESLAKRNETLRARATDLDEAAGRFSATSPANVQTPSE
ncbi:MAG: hypothetical protein ACI8VE_002390, partial [Natrialbaceae archaeon]